MINLIGRWQVGLGVFKCSGKHTYSFLFVMSIGLNELKIAFSPVALGLKAFIFCSSS